MKKPVDDGKRAEEGMVVSLTRYDDGNVRVVLDRARRVGPHEWESTGVLSFKEGSGEPDQPLVDLLQQFVAARAARY